MISLLRFPLIVGVVLIHAQFADSVFTAAALEGRDFPFYAQLSYLISQVFTKPAVPLFFLISGLLFFSGAGTFSRAVYFQKLKKRCRTLLLPYLLWNLLVLVLSYVRHKYFSGLGPSQIALEEYSAVDFLLSFWGTGQGAASRPVAFQFWFLRDLMVIMVCTPLIYYFLKKSPGLYLGLTAGLWFFNCWFDVPGISIMGLFFFSLGAAASLYGKESLLSADRGLPVLLGIYPLLSLFILYFRKAEWIFYVDQVNLLLGMALLLSLASRLLRKGRIRPSPFLERSSFFLYAYHGLAISWTLKLAVRWLQPATDLSFVLIYLVAPVLVTGAGLLLFRLMERYLPRLTGWLTGARAFHSPGTGK